MNSSAEKLPVNPDENLIIPALRLVEDPEVGMNIVDLGLVEEIRCPGDGIVEIDLLVTSPGCPLKEILMEGVRLVVSAVPGVTDVRVQFRDDVRWTPDRIRNLD